MANPVNGASAQQTAIVNPFQQRTDQVSNQDQNSNRSQRANASSGSNFVQQTSGRNSGKSSQQLVANNTDGEHKAHANGRGGLVDITV